MFAVFLKLKTLTYKSIYKLSQSISQKLGTEYQMSIEFSDRGIKKKKKKIKPYSFGMDSQGHGFMTDQDTQRLFELFRNTEVSVNVQNPQTKIQKKHIEESIL